MTAANDGGTEPAGAAEQQGIGTIVEAVARHQHGSGFVRLLPDPLDPLAWIVVLRGGVTDTIRVNCIRR